MTFASVMSRHGPWRQLLVWLNFLPWLLRVIDYRLDAFLAVSSTARLTFEFDLVCLEASCRLLS